MSSSAYPATCLELRSTLNDDGIVTLAVRECPVTTPDEMQVVVRIEAAPINPSDLGMLFAGGDAGAALADGDGMFPFVAVPVTPAVLAAQAAEAAGFEAVACTPGTVDPYSPKTVRASAGALFHVPHGLSNALVLTQVLRFNLPEAEPLYAELARGLNAPRRRRAKRDTEKPQKPPAP